MSLLEGLAEVASRTPAGLTECAALLPNECQCRLDHLFKELSTSTEPLLGS